jgi:hypothetical protein
MNTALVLALIVHLGHDDFKTRELATSKLEAILPVAGPYLLKTQSHKNSEIAVRSTYLYQKWACTVAKEIKPTKWPHLPWIDSLPKDYPDRSQLIETYLNMSEDANQPPTWLKYRTATKHFVCDLVKDGKVISEVRKMLDAMVQNEKSWIKTNQQAYKFPKEMLTLCEP